MSAANPLPTSDVSADKRPYEPSMEEILASIRRIIADDQSLPGRSASREIEGASSLVITKDVRRPIPPAPPIEPTTELAPAASADGPAGGFASNASPVDVSKPTYVEAHREPGLAHGPIAAPQFATPDGPVGDEPGEAPQDPAPVRQKLAAAAVASPRAQAPGSKAEPEAEKPFYDAPIEPASLREPLQERPELFSAATDSAVSAAFNMLAASRLADNSDELMTLAREMIRPLLRSWIDDNLPSMVERMVRAEIERVARGGR